MVSYLRSLGPGLPRSVHVLQAGLVVNAFGNGAAGPFVLVYLHNVRGIPIALAGVASAIGAAAGLASALAAATVAERIGMRATLLLGLALSTAAFVLYPLVEAAWEACLLALATGAGFGAWFSMQSTLLAAVVPADRRHVAFAHQRVAANVGLGLGGLAGGVVTAASTASSFAALFLANAATFVVYGLVVLLVDAPPAPPASARVRYGDAARDRGLLRVVAANVVVVAAAIALLNGMLPLFARNVAAISQTWIGVFFLVNSLLIVGAQLPVARALEGVRRTHALAAMSLAFAASWLVVEAAALTAGAAAALVVLAGLAVFSVAECVHAATQGPLVADLVPSRRLSHAMAANAFSWQLGFVVGPAVGGFLLGASGLALWPVAAGACVAAAWWQLRLEPMLPEAARVTPRASRPAGAARREPSPGAPR